jgi:hypothetical protein
LRGVGGVARRHYNNRADIDSDGVASPISIDCPRTNFIAALLDLACTIPLARRVETQRGFHRIEA